MYAIVRTGGKQYKVQAGDSIRVEKLDNTLGSEVELTDVLMIGGDNPVVGEPVVQNAKVTVVVTRQEKDRKVIIFKKRRRQGYRRFKSHRQHYTELFVKSITGPDGKTVKADGEAKIVNRAEERAAAQKEKTEARKEALNNKATRQERKQGKATAKKAAAPAKKKVATKKPAKTAAKKTAKKTTKK